MKKIIYILFFISMFFSLMAQEPYKEKANKKKRIELYSETLDSLSTQIKEHIESIRPNYNGDSVRAIIESAPYFSIFKDNYFIGGMPVGQKAMASNSNVKFQLSIAQRLTRSKLPFDTYLFIQFTQKTIWNVIEKSMPMRDLNFNPGIGLGHLIIYHNRYVGKSLFMLEHESNGKDGTLSRSWNKISAGASLLISPHIETQLKLWIPIVDSDNNKDITEYNGLGHLGINYRNTNKNLGISMLATWRAKSFSFNTQWEVSYKLNNNENQYLFLQYYNGYGENLLDYNKYKSILRIGFVIKPQDFSIF